MRSVFDTDPRLIELRRDVNIMAMAYRVAIRDDDTEALIVAAVELVKANQELEVVIAELEQRTARTIEALEIHLPPEDLAAIRAMWNF